MSFTASAVDPTESPVELNVPRRPPLPAGGILRSHVEKSGGVRGEAYGSATNEQQVVGGHPSMKATGMGCGNAHRDLLAAVGRWGVPQLPSGEVVMPVGLPVGPLMVRNFWLYALRGELRAVLAQSYPVYFVKNDTDIVPSVPKARRKTLTKSARRARAAQKALVAAAKPPPPDRAEMYRRIGRPLGAEPGPWPTIKPECAPKDFEDALLFWDLVQHFRKWQVVDRSDGLPVLIWPNGVKGYMKTLPDRWKYRRGLNDIYHRFRSLFLICCPHLDLLWYQKSYVKLDEPRMLPPRAR